MAKTRRPGQKQPQRRSTNRPVRIPVAVPATEPAPLPVVFEPRSGTPYPELLRNPGYVWWRSLLGVLLGLVLYLVAVVPLVTNLVLAIAWWIAGRSEPYPHYYTAALRFERIGGFLATNLGIASLIVVSALIMVLIHRTRPAWLASVASRVRRRYLLLCVPIALVVFGVSLTLGALLGPHPSWAPQPGAVGFLVVLVLTSPLQAAAEEVFFRGYLMQALGSLVSNPWFGVLISAGVFALLHGSQNPPLLLNRLAFGLIAAVLVLKTGGIEAGIAVHVVNNLLAFGFAALTSSIAATRAVTAIGWSQAGFDAAGYAVFALLAYLLWRRLGLRRTVGDGTEGLSPAPAVE